MGGSPEEELIGSYRTFADARKVARESLLCEDRQDYIVYVEDKLEQGNKYTNSIKEIYKVRNDKDDDAKGNEDFCIYTWNDHGKRRCALSVLSVSDVNRICYPGDSERIWVQKGALGACMTHPDTEEESLGRGVKSSKSEAAPKQQKKNNSGKRSQPSRTTRSTTRTSKRVKRA